MALMPKRVKYRKSQRRRIRGNATRGNRVSLGDFGLQSLQAGYVKATTIEACRVSAMQYIRGDGKLYIRIFPDKPISKKPAETRMGHGKGNPEEWVAVVRPGRVMYELEGVDEKLARAAFHLAHHKLPVDTRVVSRETPI